MPTLDPGDSAQGDFRSAVAGAPEAAAAEEWRARQLRVARVARRILLANTDACTVRGHDFGLETRPATLMSSGAPVAVVWPDGPAFRAGLREGDLVRAVNGVPWSADRIERAQFNAALEAVSQGDRLELRVERDGAVRTVTLISQQRCDAEVRLSPRTFVNATAVDATIVIEGGLERLLPDDTELAFAVAHEAAHIIQGHTAAEQHGAIGDRPQRLAMEREADALGLRLMARAGYEPAAAARAWPKIADASRAPLLRLMDIHGPYMSTPERIAFLTDEAARIATGPGRVHPLSR